ncbi:hypothetical protein MHBO_001245 [Bonamia ostreae]|uniref:Uncharacterized protein n=1 Tax=Bonamia ostreae TaxID=126728 RepID=A0ABV2AIG2_9EUKA
METETTNIRKVNCKTADSTSTGFFAFSTASIFYGLSLSEAIPFSALSMLYSLVFGGFLQILCGFNQFLNGDVFYGTFFTVFGAHWILQYFVDILVVDSKNAIVDSVLWAAISIVFAVNSLDKNWIIILFLGELVAYFFVEMIVMAVGKGRVAMGVFLTLIGLSSFFLASVEFTVQNGGISVGDKFKIFATKRDCSISKFLLILMFDIIFIGEEPSSLKRFDDVVNVISGTIYCFIFIYSNEI